MLDQDQIRQAARALDEAETSREQTTALTAQFAGLTVKDGYAVQQAWLQLKYDRGRSIKGRKIGLTSRAMQNALGIDEPDHGVLLDDMFYGDGADLPADRFIVPRVEVELGFVLKRPLSGPDCTIFDVLSATEFVTPALEILDARMHRIDPRSGKPRTVIDTIADNAANAAIVVGGRPFRPMDTDLRWVAGLCFRNGIIEESGVAAAVLNHPAHGIAWLANRLAAHEVSLEAGIMILSGSFTRPVDAHKGDVFHADYGPFGSVSCRFV